MALQCASVLLLAAFAQAMTLLESQRDEAASWYLQMLNEKTDVGYLPKVPHFMSWLSDARVDSGNNDDLINNYEDSARVSSGGDSSVELPATPSLVSVKRSGPMRLCGKRLMDTIVKFCKGCTKPRNFKMVGNDKRSEGAVSKRGGDLAKKCCFDRCTYDDMRAFCC